MFKLYTVKKEQKSIVQKFLSDDVIGRQTLIQKDGESYGLPSDVVILIIEAPDNVFERVEEIGKDILTELEPDLAEKIYKRVKDEESEAESGMGMLFG